MHPALNGGTVVSGHGCARPLAGTVLVVWVHTTRLCMGQWADISFAGQGRGETFPTHRPCCCGDRTDIPPLELPPSHSSPPRCTLFLLFLHSLPHHMRPSPTHTILVVFLTLGIQPTRATPSFPSPPPGTLSPSWHSQMWSFVRACAGGTRGIISLCWCREGYVCGVRGQAEVWPPNTGMVASKCTLYLRCFIPLERHNHIVSCSHNGAWLPDWVSGLSW